MKVNRHRFGILFLILFLLCLLIIGICVFDNYGATPDEINQIEAGHITFQFLSDTFGGTTDYFPDLPDLPDYYNRYYGQAATFPTVIYEAYRGFSLDSSTIIRLRHLWNYLTFFVSLCFWAFLLGKRFGSIPAAVIGTLALFLSPRIFADSFTNDRDIIFLSWLIIAFCTFFILSRRTGLFASLFMGFATAIAINTRYFGLFLIIPLIFLFFAEEKKDKKWPLISIFSALMIFILITPLLWENPVKGFRDSLLNFSIGIQRSTEGLNTAEHLFFSKFYSENNLPWFYLPGWILVSMPIIPQLFSGFGILYFFGKRIKETVKSPFRLFDSMMILLLLSTLIIVSLIRPTIYNGWRHFYFLSVPILYFATFGFVSAQRQKSLILKCISFMTVFLSFGMTGTWMLQNHPFQALYFNPIFRPIASEGFEKDYWRLSTTSCLRYLLDSDSGDEISVGEYNASIDNVLAGFRPSDRSRFFIQHYFSYHREIPEYLIFNYTDTPGNRKSIPFYLPLDHVDVGAIRLATVFKRNHADEINAQDVILRASSNRNDDLVNSIVDNDPQTEWTSGRAQVSADWLEFVFKDLVRLRGISLLPGKDEREYARSLQIEYAFNESGDGEWTLISAEESGLLDYSFAPISVKRIRLRNKDAFDIPWSIREIILHQDVE